MENKQQTGLSLGRQLFNKYQALFDINEPQAQPALFEVMPQMPKAQIELFTQKSLTNHFIVTVQFNDTANKTMQTMTGRFSKQLASDRFLFTTTHENLFKIVTTSEIHYIKRLVS